MCHAIVTHLHMANVTAQRTLRTNAFAAARGDKTAMRPLDKLLWTLVPVRLCAMHMSAVSSLQDYLYSIISPYHVDAASSDRCHT